MEKLDAVKQAIDQANSQDPSMIIFQGKNQPSEWVYSQRMATCLNRFVPNASAPLAIAVYGQHIKRWQIPRSDYPEGKVGYHNWRNHLKAFHSQEVTKIMEQQGYDKGDTDRVEAIMSKRLLGKGDTECQSFEDVICLVFLESYLGAFAEKHPEDKVIPIIQKTWKKMSPRAQEMALALKLGTAEQELIRKSLM